MVLADMLVNFYDPSKKEASLRQSLLEYSIQQVAEAKALYDLSFGPSPSGAFQRLLVGLKTVRDSVFKGRFGIGRLPLQTKLTTSLVPFRELRRERNRDFDEVFPSDEDFRQVLTKLDSTIED
jgi:kynurenine 3-monooxygenase